MEFNVVDQDSAIYLLESKRSGLYFESFAYSMDDRAEVTQYIENAKKFDTRNKAVNYIEEHGIDDIFQVIHIPA